MHLTGVVCMSDYILELNNISKSFGPTKALSNVSFNLKESEVHALVGENGAGKSTLIKILAGIHQPDSGEIILNGSAVTINGPRASEHLGIAVVHQELLLCEPLTVAENVFLGRELMKGGLLDISSQIAATKEALSNIDPSISPTQTVEMLSPGGKQIVEITRAVATGAKIIIFDEPTSSLSEKETEKLYEIIEGLKAEKKSIIYISHRMEEIDRLADRVTVLRDGQSIGTLEKSEADRDTIISMMVGRNISNFYTRNNKPGDEVILDVRGLSGDAVQDISFTVKKGEIVGFSGLIGAGRTETMNLLFGIDKKTSGQIFVGGKEVKISRPDEAIKNGIVLVPEDRKLEGLFLDQTIKFNVSITKLADIIKHLHVNNAAETAMSEEYGGMMKLKCSSYEDPVLSLSGGNQQKVLIARWLACASKIVILDEPTRGIDVGAKADIYKILDELTGKGFGVIIVSSELQEIVGMCDRVYVMRQRKIGGCVEGDEITQVNIMKYATGAA